MTRLVADTAALAAALGAQDEEPVGGHQHRRAVVMTMGALHAGHLALVRRARELADHVVVTIFVNPLQFGPAEDLDRYPRDLEGDLALLSGDGLLGDGDVVFAPTPAVMYPEGDPVVRVTAGRIGEVLEGGFRPGHLDGVLTVVLKLMHLTRPGVALFGQKDAQQLAAVRRMVRDLDVPLTVVGVPIVRDSDGLALSSRNAYLTADERRRALCLSRSLAAARSAADEGGASDQILAAAVAVLTGAEGVDSLDYAALVDPSSFEEVAPGATGPALLVLAARVGATRLIDNGELTLR
ncbi:MAG: pantoate--beta-alanine ligase [Cellulomonas sp. 73-92]|uniref:pantoate--beta-alanine ligase n=1 Tax=Cellulomonas sp. 73-92 TaxID=1895740 RepID=UPI00092B9555|nr:pantoate--beta-alanine ligase [Cellulomonas sp. 73-92]OJV80755.1 MAG: pantoate--beta-alanine ligase [Cellulomonas sp. 73-92]